MVRRVAPCCSSTSARPVGPARARTGVSRDSGGQMRSIRPDRGPRPPPGAGAAAPRHRGNSRCWVRSRRPRRSRPVRSCSGRRGAPCCRRRSRLGHSPPGPQFADHVDQQHPGRSAGRLARSGCGAARASRSGRAVCATSSNRSGWRGTTISRAAGHCGKDRAQRLDRHAAPRDPGCCRPATRRPCPARRHSWRSRTVAGLSRSV